MLQFLNKLNKKQFKGRIGGVEFMQFKFYLKYYKMERGN